jgi:hypothetical protein
MLGGYMDRPAGDFTGPLCAGTSAGRRRQWPLDMYWLLAVRMYYCIVSIQYQYKWVSEHLNYIVSQTIVSIFCVEYSVRNYSPQVLFILEINFFSGSVSMVFVAYNLQTISFNCSKVSWIGFKHQTNPSYKSQYFYARISYWHLARKELMSGVLLETVGGNNYYR